MQKGYPTRTRFQQHQNWLQTLTVQARRNKRPYTKDIVVYVLEILFDATAEIQKGKALKGGISLLPAVGDGSKSETKSLAFVWSFFPPKFTDSYLCSVRTLQLGSSTSDAL
ncbi:hypothetical protein P8452_06388 [Trifolium repens]|nr:hypothetical protein P8452_06388 [Trifolium repens]